MHRIIALRLLRLQWDRALAIVCGVAAIGMLIAGWIGLSDRVDPADQIPYIMSGGIGGLLLMGLTATLWLSADLRDEWRKLDVLDQHICEVGGLDGSGERRSIVITDNGVASQPCQYAERPAR